MTAEEACAFHRPQVQALAEAGVAVVNALTMTTAAEGAGVALAAAGCGLPCTVSFTVETDGQLPDGTALGEAICAVEAVTASHTRPVFYMVNCAHPDHVLGALEAAHAAGAPWLARLGGFRGNASRMSHAELDGCDELDAGDPAEYGRLVAGMARRFGLRLVGGCCGTDKRHLQALVDAL